MSKCVFNEIYEGTNFFSDSKNKKNVTGLKFEPKEKANYKASIFYQGHSYPTKIPVEIICKYITKNTKENDVVLDPFCGSGMTGLAALLTGRKAVISDLGVMATHLATNHIRYCDPENLKQAASLVVRLSKVNNPYSIVKGKYKGEISYLIYSDILRCSNCNKQNVFWDISVDPNTITVRKKSYCSKCKSECSRANSKKTGSIPVYICLKKDGKNLSLEIPQNVRKSFIYKLKKNFSPADVLETDFNKSSEMYIRSALHLQDVEKLSDFYSERNLSALNHLYSEIMNINDPRIKAALLFAFTNTAWHGSKMRRFNKAGGHRPLTGTLYFPTLYSEANVFDVFENKIKTLVKYYVELQKYHTTSNENIKICRTSATNLSHLKSKSVDYIFTDPPFGSNIFYADCNFVGEAWLGTTTNTKNEAVINKSLKTQNGGKSIQDYETLMSESFREMARVLKPNGKLDLVFNSSEGEVWFSLVKAFENAGFSVSKTYSLEKGQKSVKGYKSSNGKENVATTDIVLTLTKCPKKIKKSSERATARTISEALSEFTKNNDVQDLRFKTSDFFNYFVQYCFLNGYSFEGVDYSDIKSKLKTELYL